ncbi:MAG: hypothetical protein M0R41_11290 [Methylobacter tundripaludum]|nr:hypothetical protein [Methylobacter tundripaludum]
MIKRLFFTAAMMLTASTGMAGTIANGVWSPSGCGSEPVVPVIDPSSVETYNQSVKAINDWQQKANAYNGCVIKEANADNALIANAANDEQARLKAAMEKLQAETTAAKDKLDKK